MIGVYLMVDNYDSFTFNLVQLFGMLGVAMDVRRNDEIAADDVDRLDPRAIVISPGPCTPDRAGVSMEVVRRFVGVRPILGVCLGHQAIAQALGGRIRRAGEVVHGKTSSVFHDGRELYLGLESPFEATRYHSLVADRDSLPAVLEVTASTADGEIMGLRHTSALCIGVQYHPESVLTKVGAKLMANFVRQVDAFWLQRGHSPC